MKISLAQITEILGIEGNKIVEIEDEAIKGLLGGDYLKGKEAILFSGLLTGPYAILLGLEFISLDGEMRLNFCNIFFGKEGKIERSQTMRIDPDSWIDKQGEYIDFVEEIGEEFNVIRLWPDGSFRFSNSQDFHSLIGAVEVERV